MAMKKLTGLLVVIASIVLAHGALPGPPQAGSFVYVAAPLSETVPLAKPNDANTMKLYEKIIPISRLDCSSFLNACLYKIAACERLTVKNLDGVKLALLDSYGIETWVHYPMGLPEHHPFPSVHADAAACASALAH
jgi:hypothetical protein